jgi:hypothetical protein
MLLLGGRDGRGGLGGNVFPAFAGDVGKRCGVGIVDVRLPSGEDADGLVGRSVFDDLNGSVFDEDGGLASGEGDVVGSHGEEEKMGSADLHPRAVLAGVDVAVVRGVWDAGSCCGGLDGIV